MIDFHAHILPAVDDGSGSLAESLSMLGMLREQGVWRVYATPHFDAMLDSPRSFLARREQAYKSLLMAAPDTSPEIKLGAEISYYPGIARMRELCELKFEDTGLLLVEMSPECHRTSEIRELCEIATMGGDTRLVIAHVERYLDKLGGVPEELLDCGALMQVNASFFIRQKTRALALKLLSRGEIHLIGSDCHGEKYRPPLLAEAYGIIKNKLGEEKLCEILAFAESVAR